MRAETTRFPLAAAGRSAVGLKPAVRTPVFRYPLVGQEDSIIKEFPDGRKEYLGKVAPRITVEERIITIPLRHGWRNPE